MFLLVVVTLLGTLEQKFNGLYETQRKWFDSFYVTNWEVLKDKEIPLLLPGGYLLMAVLSIDLLCGALIKARKSWRAPGMVIAHGSILFMLLAGIVSFYGKIDGNTFIWEGDTSDKVAYFHDRIVEVEKYTPSEGSDSSRTSNIVRCSWLL